MNIKSYNLSAVNTSLESNCDLTIDGLLGSDVLRALAARIDCYSLRLYLRAGE
jgi:hypothetical protein